ncbi:MAG: GNAT family N-acetyltransferase [Roseobacter sp.]
MDTAHIRSFVAADKAWLVEEHQRLYARDEGFDRTFGALVSDILDDFLLSHDPSAEAGWIVEQDGTRVGSIFCVRLTERAAKLRLFLLVPEARGQGLGARMLKHCMSFARDKGYQIMQLWTHESHAAACALYQKHGWTLISSKPVVSFGQNLIEQSWQTEL